MVLSPIPHNYQRKEAIDNTSKTPTQVTPEITKGIYPENQRHQVLSDQEPQGLQGKETKRK